MAARHRFWFQRRSATALLGYVAMICVVALFAATPAFAQQERELRILRLRGSVRPRPLMPATVEIASIDPETLELRSLGQVTTDEFGFFSARVIDEGPLLAVVRRARSRHGGIMDGSLGARFSAATWGFMAVLGGGAPRDRAELHISPLTSFAAARLMVMAARALPGCLEESKVSALHRELAGEFGLPGRLDLRLVAAREISERPNDALLAKRAGLAASALSLVHAGLCEQARSAGLSGLRDLVLALAADFADGRFDGLGPGVSPASCESLLLRGRDLGQQLAPTALAAAARRYASTDPALAVLARGAFAPTLEALARATLIPRWNAPPRFVAPRSLVIDSSVPLHRVVLARLTAGTSAEDLAGQRVTLAVASSDPSLLPAPEVVGRGAQRSLELRPLAGGQGSLTLTLEARDDGGHEGVGFDSYHATMSVRITSSRDTPSLAKIANQRLPEDCGVYEIELEGLRGVGGEPLTGLGISAHSSARDLLPDPLVERRAGRFLLALKPSLEATGRARVRVRIESRRGGAFERSFEVVVVAVNDPPRVPRLSAQRGHANLPGFFEIEGLGPGGGGDEVGQSLSLELRSNSPTLFSRLSVRALPGGRARVDFRPAPNRTGRALVTLVARDDGAPRGVRERSFELSISSLLGVSARHFVKLDTAARAWRVTGYGLADFGAIEAIALDARKERLYAVDDGLDQLLVFDLTTGVARPLGNPLDYRSVRALACEPRSGALFGIDCARDLLLRIDPVTGVARPAGPMGLGFDQIEGIAFDPTTGALYGCDAELDALVTIDVNSGEATSVGPLGFDGVFSLAFDPTSSRLFGCDLTTNQLLSIDPTTGRARPVGRVKLGFNKIRALSFDRLGGTLLGVDADRDALLRLDVSLGSGVALGSLRLSGLKALAFDDQSGRLYGAGHGSSLVTIEHGSGIPHLFGPPRLAFEGRPTRGLAALAWDAAERRLFGLIEGEGALIVIDPKRGLARRLGRANALGAPDFGGVRALAWSEQARRLFAIAAGEGSLLEIDPLRGRIQRLGEAGALKDQGFDNVTTLAFDQRRGRLVGVDSRRRELVAIALRDARARSIGPLAFHNVGGLTYSRRDDRLYGLELRRDLLLDLDPESGATRVVGASGFRGLHACAFDPATRRLYAFDGRTRQLVSIAAGSGRVEVLGALGVSIHGLAFDATNRSLFGVDNQGRLLRIAPQKAEVEVVGSTGLDDLRGLAFSRRSRRLLGVCGDSGAARLVSIDPTSGAARVVGPLRYEAVESLAVDPRTDLLYGTSSKHRELLLIDQQTGRARMLGRTPSGLGAIRGLAFGD